MTIDELLALNGLTGSDEIPVWDAEDSGEPTKKITAQNFANSVKSLASLLGTGDVVNDLTRDATKVPSAECVYDRIAKYTQQNITFTNGKAEGLSCSEYLGVTNAIVVKVQGTDAFWSTVINSGRKTDTTKFDVNLPDATGYSGTISCDIVYLPL